MMEEWKSIDGFEGFYEVSNFGNVRSLNWNTREVKNLSPFMQNRGYLQVRLSDGKTYKAFMVHRLVAAAFVDGYSENMVVNHINERKTDNRACNLEWVTQSENTLYSMPSRSKRKPRAVEIIQLSATGNELRRFSNFIEIQKEFGFDLSSIRGCCKGQRKTAYGYKWRYAA